VSSVNNSAWKAGSWMGLAILTKSWPVLALPSILKGSPTIQKKFIVLFLVCLIPLLGVMIYTMAFESDIKVILSNALSYNHGLGVWGYTYFLRLLMLLKPNIEYFFRWVVEYARFITLFCLGFVWFWRARHESPAAGILTILVSFLALTHAFAIQYLVWVLPFAIIVNNNRWLNTYTITGYLYMFLAYFGLILTPSITWVMPLPQADWFIIMPAALPVWIVTIFWMIDRLKDNQSKFIAPVM
jgi:hypothetical protein